jgi:hypothetical protein
MALDHELSEEVHGLIRQSERGKFLAPLWRDADGPLLTAERLCDSNPSAVPEIYHAIIQYRLALLALRDIKSLKKDELVKVSDRLNKLTGRSEFGPWPLLYQMVALRKLKDKEGLQRVFRKVVESVSHHSGLVRGIRDVDLDGVDYPGIAQSHIFNALELATFFCELEYGPLASILDSFMGSPTRFVPGISPESLDWVMICFRNGIKFHRNMEQPFIESAAKSYFEDACKRGEKALLLCLNLTENVNQVRCHCSDELHGRKWTRDVKADPLIRVLKSRAENTTERDHCTRLKHLFGDSITFSDSGVALTGAATLIVTMAGRKWVESCERDG